MFQQLRCACRSFPGSRSPRRWQEDPPPDPPRGWAGWIPVAHSRMAPKSWMVQPSMVIFNGKLLVYRRLHGNTTSKKTWMIQGIPMFLELSIPISYTFGLIPERVHFFDQVRSSFLTCGKPSANPQVPRQVWNI